jgi:hypothetical protein
MKLRKHIDQTRELTSIDENSGTLWNNVSFVLRGFQKYYRRC